MKKYFYHISVLLFGVFLIVGCDGQKPNEPATSTPEEPMEEPAEREAKAEPLSEMPYIISVKEAETQPEGATGIQSSAHGYNGTYLMMVGGRIQGFHGTANAGGVFASQYSNNQIAILNPQTGDFKSLPVPEKHHDHLFPKF